VRREQQAEGKKGRRKETEDVVGRDGREEGIVEG
jgi:hypothetical protein